MPVLIGYQLFWLCRLFAIFDIGSRHWLASLSFGRLKLLLRHLSLMAGSLADIAIVFHGKYP